MEQFNRMSGSSGGPGQKPDKRKGYSSPEANPFRRFTAQGNPDPGFAAPASSKSEGLESREPIKKRQIEPTPEAAIQPGVRLVAFVIDCLLCYLLAVLTALIPFVNRMLTLPTAMALVFLTRDFFFAGHGFGKNLMGLKVIDATTGEPPTLLQSALRNIILIAPFVAFQIIVTILKFLPLAWLDQAVEQICQIICTVYIIIVLPLEGYRTLSRPDGLRKGDELANTRIVEAQMDFSRFLPPPKA